MKRLLPLLLLAVLSLPASAVADGCFGPCNGVSLNPPGTSLLAAQPFGEGGPFVAYDRATGRVRYTLGGGVPSADGRWYFTGLRRKAQTTIRRHDTRTGRVAATFVIGRGGWVSSVSANANRLTLTRGTPRGTAIEVVDTVRQAVTHSLTLRGAWEVETVSIDGRRLFLVEDLRGDAGRYRVRLYDLVRKRLLGRVLKGEGEPAVMTGLGVRAIAFRTGVGS
ncbi:MAG: hypothetical protein ABR583_10355 [Gaiellaceae bacterium]